jgi:endonuclease YncB( thermonuclease family)
MSFFRRLFLAAATAILCTTTSTLAIELAATVVAIPDGETILIDHGGQRETIRLHGVECPDRIKPTARQYLTSLALGKQVVVVILGHDSRGKPVGDVFMQDGHMLNGELIRMGLAWTDGTSYVMFNELEDEARAENRGIWSQTVRRAPGRKPPHRLRR